MAGERLPARFSLRSQLWFRWTGKRFEIATSHMQTDVYETVPFHMKIEASTPDEYVAQLPEERKEAFQKLRALLKENLPEGFEETMSYGMVGYVVPHSRYPAGYHCNPKEPLPFISLGNQKNYIALYHLGLYVEPALLTWFTEEYPKHSPTKLDMGKSCIRFKKMENIPYALLGTLAQKMTPDAWITLYEKEVKR